MPKDYAFHREKQYWVFLHTAVAFCVPIIHTLTIRQSTLGNGIYMLITDCRKCSQLVRSREITPPDCVLGFPDRFSRHSNPTIVCKEAHDFPPVSFIHTAWVPDLYWQTLSSLEIILVKKKAKC